MASFSSSLPSTATTAGGPRGRSAARREAPALLFDLQKSLDFFSSAALTRALAESVSLSWKSYDDSLFLNAVYTLMPWKEKPGTVEMHMSRRAEVQERYDQIYRRMVDVWIDSMAQGPDACHRYMSRIEEIREKDRLHFETTGNEARAANQEIAGDLTGAIRRCAQIKLASTIAVAACSGGLSVHAATMGGAAAVANAAGLVNTAYSISASVIGNWERAPSAQLIGVTWESAKYAGAATADAIADRSIQDAAAATHEQVLKHALSRMHQAEEGFRNAVRHRGRANAARAYGRAANEATAAAGRLNEARAQIGRAVKLKVGAALFFTALDVIQGIDDYLEDVAD